MGEHFLIYGECDLALAAEPGFHCMTPCGVDAAAITLPHFLDCRIRAVVNPLESGVAFPLAKAGTGLIVI